MTVADRDNKIPILALGLLMCDDSQPAILFMLVKIAREVSRLP